MKTRSIMVLVLLLSISSAFAQADWVWTESGGGSGDDYANGFAVDTNGNSYVTGSFRGNATFGSTVLTASLNSDIFVAKMDMNGNWLWAVGVGAGAFDGGNSICVDTDGNAYVVGYFDYTVHFGDYELVSDGGYDGFVSKINSDGVWQWATNIGGTNYGYASDIVLDSEGNPYVTGYFIGTALFGGISVVSNGDYDVFIAKLDSSGNWLNVLRAGSTDYESSSSINLDDSDNPYITGTFEGNTTFGSTSLTGIGNDDIFIAKANSSLTSWIWAKKAGGSSNDRGTDIKVDGSGNSYVTGSFANSATFGTITLTALGYYEDLFVTKLNSNGDWLWAISAGGYQGYDNGRAIDIDDNGNSYLTGNFRYTCHFGTNEVISNGYDDIFIAKLNSDGDEWLWAINAGGSDNDHGNDIYKADGDVIYITGYFKDSVTFGSTSLTSAGYSDIFVSKLEDNSPPNTPENVQISIVGTQVQITWDEVPGCTYTVYSDSDPEGDFSNVEQTGITGTNWSETIPGTKLFYRVTASE